MTYSRGTTAAERAVCIEIGGGGVQTVVFDCAPLRLDGAPVRLDARRALLDGTPTPAFRNAVLVLPDDGSVPTFLEGAHEIAGAPLLIAVPGIVSDGRVVAASNLGWFDVDPVTALGLSGPAEIVTNDAEAAALGEAALRGVDDLAYLGLGTGIGGAIVLDGEVVEREVFGHMPGFGDAPCNCGRAGCLETVAAGWALPDPLPPERIAGVARALATALRTVDGPMTVIGGGLARAYPAIVDAVAAEVPERTVEASRAPAAAKSAAPWGLLRLAGIEPAGLSAIRAASGTPPR